MNQNYNYEAVKFCIAKNKYCNQMNITIDSRKYYIWLRHEMDRQGGYTNNYHVYAKVEFTDGMEFRPRNDAVGDLYYIKLNRSDVIKLLGEEAINF